MSEQEITFAELLDQEEAEEVARWGVPAGSTDVDIRLDWLLEKIAKRRAMLARNNAIAEARKLHVEDWRQSTNRRLESAISWLQGEVRNLVPQTAEAFQGLYGQKSRSLPFGVIGFRKHPDRLEVFDEAKALEWAKAHGVPTRIVETVGKGDLKAALKAGVEPDGFEVIRGLDEFYVKSDTLEEDR